MSDIEDMGTHQESDQENNKKEDVSDISKNVLKKKLEENSLLDYQPVSEVGVISSLTEIKGTIISRGHIRIEGNVTGNISATGDIKVMGRVIGDIKGCNVELAGCTLEGDILARGDISVDQDSTFKGNMKGQLITLDGHVNGIVEANKGAHMSNTSMLKGSMATPTLSMSSGAEMQGRVHVSKKGKD